MSETEPPTAPDLAEYEPLEGRAKVLVRALVVAVVVDAVAVASGILELRLLDRVDVASMSEIESNDMRQMLVGIMQLSVLIIAAVLFIRWLRCITANLGALGAVDLRYGVGWATWGWFVPILNLWRPKQVINDAWRASDPNGPAREWQQWRSGSVPRALTAWWAAWIISGLMYQSSFRASLRAETPEQVKAASQTMVAADIVSILSGIGAIWVVRALTRRQQKRRDVLASEAVQPADPPEADPPL